MRVLVAWHVDQTLLAGSVRRAFSHHLFLQVRQPVIALRLVNLGTGGKIMFIVVHDDLAGKPQCPHSSQFIFRNPEELDWKYGYLLKSSCHNPWGN